MTTKTIKAKRFKLNYCGHLAEDNGGAGTLTIRLITEDEMDFPRVIDIDGIDTPCMAYVFDAEHEGLVCYLNDADANAFAQQFLTNNSVAV